MTTMKNLFKLWISIVIVAIASACSTEPDYAEPNFAEQEGAPIEILLGADIEQTELNRVSFQESADAIVCDWETTDQLGVYAVTFKTATETTPTGTSSSRNNQPFDYNGDYFAGSMSTTTSAYGWAYNAYYPYDAAAGTGETAKVLCITSDRTQSGNTYNSAYDLMTSNIIQYNAGEKLPAERLGTDENGDPVNFQMTRQLGLLYFHFTSAEDWAANEEVVAVNIESDSYVGYETYKIKRLNEGINSVEDGYKTIQLAYDAENRPTAADFKAFFNIHPGDHTLTFTILTENHKATFTSKSALTIEAGNCYRNSIAIASTKWENNVIPTLAAPVLNETVVVTPTTATISWAAVEGVTEYKYEVKAADNTTVELSGTTTETSITLSNLTPATTLTKNISVQAIGNGVDYNSSEIASKEYVFTLEDAQKLAAPVLITTATVLGTTATISWNEVENATGYDYSYTIEGGESAEGTTNDTEVSIDDLTAGATYTVTFNVTALGDGVGYSTSDMATYEYTIVMPSAGTEVTYVWDFASTDFDEYATAIGTSDNEQYVGTWNGLTITAGGGSIKMTTGNSIRCLRLGGGGDTTKRALSFTANGKGTLKVVASNTGSSQATGRNVIVDVNNTKQTADGGAGTTKSPVTCEFTVDVSEETTVYVYTSKSLNIYSLTYTETLQ